MRVLDDGVKMVSTTSKVLIGLIVFFVVAAIAILIYVVLHKSSTPSGGGGGNGGGGTNPTPGSYKTVCSSSQACNTGLTCDTTGVCLVSPNGPCTGSQSQCASTTSVINQCIGGYCVPPSTNTLGSSPPCNSPLILSSSTNTCLGDIGYTVCKGNNDCNSGICFEGTCLAGIPDGYACTSTGSPCLSTSSCSNGYCQPSGVTTADIGASCVIVGTCDPYPPVDGTTDRGGASCTSGTSVCICSSTGTIGTCTPVTSISNLNQVCNTNTQCSPTLTCVSNPASTSTICQFSTPNPNAITGSTTQCIGGFAPTPGGYCRANNGILCSSVTDCNGLAGTSSSSVTCSAMSSGLTVLDIAITNPNAQALQITNATSISIVSTSLNLPTGEDLIEFGAITNFEIYTMPNGYVGVYNKSGRWTGYGLPLTTDAIPVITGISSTAYIKGFNLITTINNVNFGGSNSGAIIVDTDEIGVISYIDIIGAGINGPGDYYGGLHTLPSIVFASMNNDTLALVDATGKIYTASPPTNVSCAVTSGSTAACTPSSAFVMTQLSVSMLPNTPNNSSKIILYNATGSSLAYMSANTVVFSANVADTIQPYSNTINLPAGYNLIDFAVYRNPNFVMMLVTQGTGPCYVCIYEGNAGTGLDGIMTILPGAYSNNTRIFIDSNGYHIVGNTICQPSS